MIVLAAALLRLTALAQDYFIDNVYGNDTNSGYSEGSAWQSLSNVNSTAFDPGDKILFKKGGTWDESITINNSGEYQNPIIISNYGEGDLPVINACGRNCAIYLSNVSYLTIDGIKVTNSADDIQNRTGIYVSRSDGGTSYDIKIENNEVTDIDGNCGNFDNAGIFCVASSGKFNGLYIVNNYVHDLKTIGIYLLSHHESGVNLSRDVLIRKNTIERNGRDGIIVTNALNPLVEYNKLLYIGSEGTGLNWIAGIFPTRCTNGIIQHNEVGNMVESGDSYAYDLDVGCSGTFYYQYNYSHDNAGGFYMQPKGSFQNDTDKAIVRYNISINEHGGVRIQNPHVELYNNVFYDAVNALVIGSSSTGGQSDVKFYNNIFMSPGVPTYWYEFEFDNNIYYGHNIFTHNGINKISMVLLGGYHSNFTIADPKFVSATVAAPEDCKLQTNSPAIGKGTDTPEVARDYFGNTIYAGYTDIGAYSSDVENITINSQSITRTKTTASDISQKYTTELNADKATRNGTANIGNIFTSCDSGDWICFNGVDFGCGASNLFIKSAVASGFDKKNVSVRIDSVSSNEIGRFAVNATSSWFDFMQNRVELDCVYGVHDVYLVFGGGASVDDCMFPYLYGIGNFTDIVLK